MASPQPTTHQRPERRDFRNEVTESIIAMLEQGVAPWQKPCDAANIGNLAVPYNPTSNNRYRGGNAIYLMATAQQKGYDDPRWVTYKQAAAQGWQVRAGEKGTQIEFWEPKKPAHHDGKALPTGAEPNTAGTNPSERQFIHRVYTVFNAKQIDRIPVQGPKTHSAFAAVQAGEQILVNSGARIEHDQTDSAFYSRSTDSIHLPPRNAFHDAPGFYGTALHELFHWAGHPDRLNRKTLNEAYRFGDQNYAREELRAELASLFLAAERGIPHDPAHHAAYVGSWIKALRNDKNEIFHAAQDASRGAEFLLALERDKSVAQAMADAPEAITGTLQEETAQLQSDREAASEAAPSTSPTVVQEAAEAVGRFAPEDGTLRIHDNRTGIDYPAGFDPAKLAAVSTGNEPVNAAPLRDSVKSLRAAEAIAIKHLGSDARTDFAAINDGIYRGVVLGATDAHVVQQTSKTTAVAHPKELLDFEPRAGQRLAITYRDAHALVREVQERSRGQEMGR